MNNFNNFLNHLNSFGNKQQPKPGLWVNGNSTQKSSLNESIFLNHLNSFSNKQPIQEGQTERMRIARIRKLRDQGMLIPYHNFDSVLYDETPITTGAAAGAAAGAAIFGAPTAGAGMIPGAIMGGLAGAGVGVGFNALPKVINKYSSNPQYDTNVDRVQKRTEEEEQKRREDVSKANPDLAARMQEDPRNRPGIGKGIARAMNDMSRMQTKVNAANINENTYRSIFLNHLNSFSNNIQEQRKLTRYEQGAIQRAKAKKQQAMAELDKTLDALPTRMPQKLRVISPGTEIGPSSRLLRAGESATETPPTQPAPAPTQYPQSTFANAEASRQTYPSLGTNPRDINGDFMVTPEEMRYKAWIRQGV